MTTTEWISLQLAGDARLILQRVPPALQAAPLAAELGAVVVDDLRPPVAGRVRVMDARQWRAFPDFDSRRSLIASETTQSPLIVLLDTASATALALSSPHVVSWAGGIWLPPDHPLRGVRTDEEVTAGERMLRVALARDPELARRFAGQEVAVDLLSGRVFGRVGTSTALDVAKEYLDEGVVYLEHLP